MTKNTGLSRPAGIFLLFNCQIPAVMETAGEGGAWGMALLASYMILKRENQTLEEYLAEEVFTGAGKTVVRPEREAVLGFEKFMEHYREDLAIEQAAVSHLK